MTAPPCAVHPAAPVAHAAPFLPQKTIVKEETELAFPTGTAGTPHTALPPPCLAAGTAAAVALELETPATEGSGDALAHELSDRLHLGPVYPEGGPLSGIKRPHAPKSAYFRRRVRSDAAVAAGRKLCAWADSPASGISAGDRNRLRVVGAVMKHGRRRKEFGNKPHHTDETRHAMAIMMFGRRHGAAPNADTLAKQVNEDIGAPAALHSKTMRREIVEMTTYHGQRLALDKIKKVCDTPAVKALVADW